MANDNNSNGGGSALPWVLGGALGLGALGLGWKMMNDAEKRAEEREEDLLDEAREREEELLRELQDARSPAHDASGASGGFNVSGGFSLPARGSSGGTYSNVGAGIGGLLDIFLPIVTGG